MKGVSLSATPHSFIPSTHGSLLRFEPCRQVRGFQPLTVAAFAVCVRDAIHPPVCEHTAYVFHPVHAWLIAARKKPAIIRSPVLKSDRRGSNSRPPPWQGGVLPTVLLSHLLSCDESCHQSDRRGSNSRPPPWQGGVQLYYYRICCRFRGGHELIYLSVSGMSTVFLIIGYYPNYLTSADPTPRTSSLP